MHKRIHLDVVTVHATTISEVLAGHCRVPIHTGSQDQFAHLGESQHCFHNFNLNPMMHSQEED